MKKQIKKQKKNIKELILATFIFWGYFILGIIGGFILIPDSILKLSINVLGFGALGFIAIDLILSIYFDFKELNKKCEGLEINFQAFTNQK